jgi:hypothetical protein
MATLRQCGERDRDIAESATHSTIPATGTYTRYMPFSRWGEPSDPVGKWDVV